MICLKKKHWFIKEDDNHILITRNFCTSHSKFCHKVICTIPLQRISLKSESAIEITHTNSSWNSAKSLCTFVNEVACQFHHHTSFVNLSRRFFSSSTIIWITQLIKWNNGLTRFKKTETMVSFILTGFERWRKITKTDEDSTAVEKWTALQEP